MPWEFFNRKHLYMRNSRQRTFGKRSSIHEKFSTCTFYYKRTSLQSKLSTRELIYKRNSLQKNFYTVRIILKNKHKQKTSIPNKFITNHPKNCMFQSQWIPENFSTIEFLYKILLYNKCYLQQTCRHIATTH